MKEEKRIRSLEELKKLCNEGYKEFYVLSGGMLKGSREIYYNKEDKSWYLWYNVSDTEHCYKNDDEFIKEEFIIMEAMKKGCFLRD
tara:strand:+ start:1684 stop:1941 length:258 start_codon:yes stop_codon:yes gene_type:complete